MEKKNTERGDGICLRKNGSAGVSENLVTYAVATSGERKSAQDETTRKCTTSGLLPLTEVPPRALCSSGEKREKKEKRETDYYRNLYYANKLNMEWEVLKHSKTKRQLKEFLKAYILYSAPFTNNNT